MTFEGRGCRHTARKLEAGLVAVLATLAACAGNDEQDGSPGGFSVPECTDSLPLADRPGFELCAGNIEHRVSAEQCAPPLPSGCAQASGCQTNADCVDEAHGYCAQTLPPGGTCSCSYGCVQDSDCLPDQLCECGSPVGRCLVAKCRTDADCGSGKVCARTLFDDCSRGYACQSAADECADGTCAADQTCVMGETKRYCKKVSICCVSPASCA